MPYLFLALILLATLTSWRWWQLARHKRSEDETLAGLAITETRLQYVSAVLMAGAFITGVATYI